MEFQEKIAKYTGHQLNSLADVEAILKVARQIDIRWKPNYSVSCSSVEPLNLTIFMAGNITLHVKRGEWLLYKPQVGGVGALYTLSQEQMDERYEAVPDEQIRQQRERDAGVAVHGANGVRQAVYDNGQQAQGHGQQNFGLIAKAGAKL